MSELETRYLALEELESSGNGIDNSRRRAEEEEEEEEEKRSHGSSLWRTFVASAGAASINSTPVSSSSSSSSPLSSSSFYSSSPSSSPSSSSVVPPLKSSFEPAAPSFLDDVRSTPFYGAFVSCWHDALSSCSRSQGDGRIRPLLLSVDSASSSSSSFLLSIFSCTPRSWILLLYLFFSSLIVCLLFYFNGFAASTAFGRPQEVTCYTTLWPGPLGCGERALECQPSETPASQSELYRCPAHCDWSSFSQRVIGSGFYRADSYLCASAIHAGALNAEEGGIVRLQRTGARSHFSSSRLNGMRSSAFYSYFPLSYRFVPLAPELQTHGSYFYGTLLLAAVLALFGLTLLRPPPGALMLVLLLFGYFYAAFALDPKSNANDAFWTSTVQVVYLLAFAFCLYPLGPSVTLTRNPGDDGEAVAEPPMREMTTIKEEVEKEEEEEDEVMPRPVVQSLSLSSRATHSSPNACSTQYPSSSLISLSSPPSKDAPNSDGGSIDDNIRSRCSNLCTKVFPAWLTSRFAFVIATPPDLHARGSHLREWHELFLFYVLPFLAAIHWNYLTFLLPDIDLNNQIFNHGALGNAVLLAFAVLVIAFVVNQVRLIRAAKLVARYLRLYALALLPVLFVTLVWSASYSIHLHHVFVGPLLLPLTRFRTRFSMTSQAVLLGMFINGLALWGVASLWDYTPAAATPDWRNPYIQAGHVRVLNATSTSLDLIWPVHNSTGKALGSILLLNNVLMYRANYQLSQFWRNDTDDNSSSIADPEPILPSSSWSLSSFSSSSASSSFSSSHALTSLSDMEDAASLSNVDVDAWSDDASYHRIVDPITGHVRFHRFSKSDRHVARPTPTEALSLPAASVAIPSLERVDTTLYVHFVLDRLMPGLDYRAYVCLTYPYGAISGCSFEVMVSTPPLP